MTDALPAVFTADDALRAGYAPSDITRLLRQGRWRALRRGVYCTAETWEGSAARPLHRYALRVRAAQRALADPAWASHLSVVRLHDLPTPAGAADRVELTAAGLGGGRSYDGLVVHAARLPPAHRAEALGIPATAPARTVVDVARSWPLPDALAVADAVLHRELATPDDYERVARDCSHSPGLTRAATVLRHADGRRESWLESASWVFFLDRALPLPQPQVRVAGYEADFGWLDQGVLGEADGREKYDRPFAGADAGDELTRRRRFFEEKQRQERLEDRGWIVVRWGFADLLQPDRLDGRIRAAFARARDRWVAIG